MNILEELISKYKGEYTTENAKSVNSPIGKLSSQPKQGVFYIDNTKLSIHINAATGANPIGEPYRITLHLNNPTSTNLEIFPVSFWDRFIFRKGKYCTKSLTRNYCFKTEKIIFLELSKDLNFTKLLEQDEVYIRLYTEENQLILTPKRGIQNLDQFENFLQILKRLEKAIL